jgi:uncharacterized protein YfaS (alpha-2-macroglobulin family)
MSTTSNIVIKKRSRNPLTAWNLIFVKILLLALIGVSLERPVGSVAGQIALEEPGFGISSYDLKNNKVYAMAYGPRNGPQVERGVWINPDGTFRIDQLPAGEYQIKLRATGYATEYVNGIFIEDGKTTKIGDAVHLSLIEPSLSVASNLRVFTTKEPPRFWANATASKNVKVSVYKTNILKLAREKSFEKWGYELSNSLDLYRNSEKKFTVPFKGETPVAVLSRDLKQDENDSSRAEFQLSKPLEAGDYVVYGEAEGVNSTKHTHAIYWFNVSDVGLVVWQAPEKTLVRAIDLNSLKPVSGAKISIFEGKDKEAQAKILATGTTGQEGFAECPLPPAVNSQGSFNSLIIGSFGKSTAYGAMNYWRSSADKTQTYFYTDRPVYRLGQTVNFKGIARSTGPSGFQNPGKNMELSVAISDPDNEELFKGKIKTSAHGTFHGLYSIPQEGKTGAYSINITYPNGTVAYENFEVAQYRKPEYQVEIKPLETRYVAGDRIKAKIHATYFFGGPVANAQVKYSVYSSTDWSSRWNLRERPDYYAFFDDWENSDEEGYSDYGGDYVEEGTIVTDANGEAIVEVQTKKVETSGDRRNSAEYRDKNYKIEAEVTDISRMTVVSSGTAKVSAGDFCVFIDPASYVVKVGDNLVSNIEAVDYNGKPVANQDITVRLSRYPWDASKYVYKPEEVLVEAQQKTDTNGKAKATFIVKDQFPTDTYYVSVEARDKQGNNVGDNSSIWIASPNYPYVLSGESAQNEPVSIRFDKAIYKPGDTARLMLSGPVNGKEGAQAVITLEGATIYSYKTVPLASTAQLIEIPIEEKHAPNVFIKAVLVTKKHQFYSQEKMIKVSPANNFLNVQISTDKKRYQPGETVKYTIKARKNDGSPAANAELSLGVVDESVYSIRPEYAQDIRKFFYARRENLVQTACSFPEQYSGGPDKIEPRVRKDFKDTAFWQPALITDKEGMATQEVKLPDNLTTWRATVRAVSMNTEVGSCINKVLSTQDLLLRLALPRFFSEGDRSFVTCIVHNYSEREQNIKLSANLSNQLKSDEPLSASFKVAPEKAYRHSWPVTVMSPGQAVISVKAVGDTKGDAMEMKVPVRALGIPAFIARAGVLKDASQSVDLKIQPPARSTGTVNVNLTVASSSMGPVIGSFDSLIDYPYGCTEQTLSRLVPSIVAFQLQKNLDMPITAAQKKKFAEIFKMGMQKLTDHHHSDGGWGWWVDDQSNMYLTSYVVEGLLMLKDCDYAIPGDMIKPGQDWLKKNVVELEKQLSDAKISIDSYDYMEKRTDLARALYALSLTGSMPDQKVVERIVQSLEKDMNYLHPETVAYMTMALKNIKKDAQAGVFYKRLLALANNAEGSMDWDQTTQMAKRILWKSPDKNRAFSYRFTGVETTALALRAVLAMEASTDKAESIKRWLLLQRGKDGWDNTKTTAEVFLVLLKDDLLNGSTKETNFSLDALKNESVVAQLNFDQKSRYAGETKIPLSREMKDGTVSLKKEGPGKLYYTLLQTYFKKLSPGENVDAEALPQGLKISRKFFRLETVKQASTGTLHYRTVPISGGQIKSAETVLMKVYVDSPVRVPYIIVESPLPSGAEVVQSHKSEELEGAGGGSAIEGDWGSPWWTHQDVLDDRIVFFGTEMPAGKSEFHTLLRMELPGEVQLNPVSFEGMYTKNVRGYSMLDALKITD